MTSSRFGLPRDSPTGSEEELYFQARRPVDTRLFAQQPKDHTMTADPFKHGKIDLKQEVKKEIKTALKSPPKHFDNPKFSARPSTVNTDLGIKNAPGLIQSPTLKRLQATGLTAESMDPATAMMMAMGDQLTTSMAQLTTQVEGIAATTKPAIAEKKRPW
jgi:hypothetical protein